MDRFSTDEWNPNQGAFWQHAIAGSIAGLAEHSLMFPVDSVKTHMQVSRTSVATISEMIKSCGVPRLWRGVQTMFTGCIPAHAAYFSIYENFKPSLIRSIAHSPYATATDRLAGTREGSTAQACGAGAAVALATVAHDCIMTPLDVVKQRLQLGLHENSIADAFSTILREQGPRAFFVSLPLTLCSNIPYAVVMGSTNEMLRKALAGDSEEPSAYGHMAAGACSGALAAAATAPLDAVKTRLQTQHLASLGVEGAHMVYSSFAPSCHANHSQSRSQSLNPEPFSCAHPRWVALLKRCCTQTLRKRARLYTPMEGSVLSTVASRRGCYSTLQALRSAGQLTRRPSSSSVALSASVPRPASSRRRQRRSLLRCRTGLWTQNTQSRSWTT